MDGPTKRLLDSIVGYMESAPPNVSNDLLHDLKGISEHIMEDSVANSPVSPGQLAVADAMGTEQPQPVTDDIEDVEKSPGEREAEGIV